jgi:hypothetical protein
VRNTTGAAAAVVALALLGSGCSTSPTAKAAAPTKASTPATAPCPAAMARLAALGPNASNDQQGAGQLATLKACKSTSEWLKNVVPYTNSGGASGFDNCVVCGSATAPATVLQSFCAGYETQPACAG